MTLVSHREKTWTTEFTQITAAVRSLRLRDTLLDGELCAVSPHGRTDFHALQYYRAG